MPKPLYSRPSEKVFHYLRSLPIEAGARLPPVRAIAEKLNVSHSTVHKALQKLQLQGRAKLEAGNGCFLFPALESFRVAIAWEPRGPVDSAKPWKESLYAGIFSAATELKSPVTVVPLSPDPSLTLAKKLMKLVDAVDGLIILMPAELEEVRRAFEKKGKAVVFAGMPSIHQTANFVAPKDFNALHRVGLAWRASGRKRILHLSATPLERPAELLRQAGLLTGLGSPLDESCSYRRIYIPNTTEENGFKTMKAEITGKIGVDAVFCSSPNLVEGAFRAISETGVKTPNAISFISGSSFSTTTRSDITSMISPAVLVGKQLLLMLQRQIASETIPKPSISGELVDIPFHIGTSTSASENKILEATTKP